MLNLAFYYINLQHYFEKLWNWTKLTKKSKNYEQTSSQMKGVLIFSEHLEG